MEFVKKNGMYEAEFEATADFNLHIERKAGGRFLIYQKSVAHGQYAIVDNIGYHDHKDVIDITLWDLVYPKYIKVVSETEVTRAVVLPEGVAKQTGGVNTEYDPSLPIAPKQLFQDTYEDRKLLYEWITSVSKGGNDEDILPCNPFKISYWEPDYYLVIVKIRGTNYDDGWLYIETDQGSPYRVEGSDTDYAINYDD